MNEKFLRCLFCKKDGFYSKSFERYICDDCYAELKKSHTEALKNGKSKRK